MRTRRRLPPWWYNRREPPSLFFKHTHDDDDDDEDVLFFFVVRYTRASVVCLSSKRVSLVVIYKTYMLLATIILLRLLPTKKKDQLTTYDTERLSPPPSLTPHTYTEHTHTHTHTILHPSGRRITKIGIVAVQLPPPTQRQTNITSKDNNVSTGNEKKEQSLKLSHRRRRELQDHFPTALWSVGYPRDDVWRTSLYLLYLSLLFQLDFDLVHTLALFVVSYRWVFGGKYSCFGKDVSFSNRIDTHFSFSRPPEKIKLVQAGIVVCRFSACVR